ncbi:MAG: pyrroline-5-carboxylate reductase, partial [Micrococcales bacterium]
LLKAGFLPGAVSVTTKSQASADRLQDELGVIAYAQESNSEANSHAVRGADVILVAVKPAYVASVLSEVKDALQDGALVISVAAGTTIETMQNTVREDVAVIRSMPNTPAIVGRAVTGIAKGERASEKQLKIAIELFETVGSVVVVDENQIDELSTISGSGPAYVFYLIEELTSAAKTMGFDESTAELLVQQTFLGASELLAASGKTPQQLRAQVTSPNGTTMRAIAELEAAGLQAIFEKATKAALARAKEIASQKG